jgi:hypothetical protein
MSPMTYARPRVSLLGDVVDVGCRRCGWSATSHHTAHAHVDAMRRAHRCPPWPYLRHAALVVGRALRDAGERLRRWGARGMH